MTRDEVMEYVGSENPKAVKLDDLDDAIVGFADQMDGPVLVYSYTKIVENIIERGDGTYEEAVEYVDYNVMRAIPYMGPHQPIILQPVTE